ncbi:MAG: hypothetical protein M0Z55_05525 [Peptococcaceae bacterium]|nr:hypothetical protein [Peptococcaceae bacterium]
MQNKINSIQAKALHLIRLFLDVVILLLLILSAISFTIKWLPLFTNAKHFFDSFYPMIDNLFLIIVILEVGDVIRKASPSRLMDILMTVLVRKIIITQDTTVPWLDVLLFALVAVIRFLWTKWIPSANSYCSEDE